MTRKGRATPLAEPHASPLRDAAPSETSPYRSRLRIGVLGPNLCDEAQSTLGFAVGAGIARRGGILVCGGLGGMMEAAAKGAKEAGGLTIGILPGENAADANRFIDLPLPTGLGAFRNMILVRACEAVIAIQGQYGTLSEIAFALRLGIPVIGLQTWELSKQGTIDPEMVVAADAEEAVEKAFARARRP